MGHKVHPIGFRIGVIENWRSRWYTKNRKDIGALVVEDAKIRQAIRKADRARDAGIARIEIERAGDMVRVILYAARPGALVGRKGVRAGQIEEEIAKITRKRVEVYVKNVENLMLDAQLVASAIAGELERRMPHKRVLHKYADQIMQEGARGVKIQVKGRLGGAEIARAEAITLGKVPLQTLMAEIDYATATAHLSKGTIGVKVWISKRDRRLDEKKEGPAVAPAKAS